MVGIYTHLEYEQWKRYFMLFFLLVLHFNSPHQTILPFWMAIAVETPFRNVIPRVCVCVAYSEYRIGFGTGIQCHNSIYKYAANTSVLLIYFILHKRKIKLSFIRTLSNIQSHKRTQLDGNEARVGIEYMRAVFSWHVEWRCEHLCVCIFIV